ncbi:MAG: hypothetical protein C0410_02675 [Anaerolinea sp.]|nr:hypothetical protein [Anaerolinea sp.]
MRKYAEYSLRNKIIQIIAVISVVVLPVMVGFLIRINIKIGIVMIALVAFFVALRFFSLDIVVYIIALAWWLPINVAPSFLGPLAYTLRLPEVIIYMGLLLLLFSNFNNSRQTKQNVLRDPIWIFLISLLLGGLIASGNILTLPGYAMFRQSTFLFISVIIVCRYLLTTQEKIYHTLELLLISNVLFDAFILIAPIFPGIFFEKALSYLITSRLGGIYMIPRIGSIYFGPNTIGLIVGIGAVIALTFALFDTGLKKSLLAGAVYLLNLIVLAMTGSRASFASMLIAIIPVLLYALRVKKKTRVILYAAALIIGLMIILPKIITIETLDRIQSTTSFYNDPSGQTRLYLIEKGIDLFRRNPFGIGYGTFVTLTDNFIMWEQNFFLNTALGGGFLGLVGLLGFFFILFWRGTSKCVSERRHNTGYNCLACLGASLAFFLNSLLTDPNISDGVSFAWLVLGITFASISLPGAKPLDSSDQITKAT